MNTRITLSAAAASFAIALSLGLPTAASADDFADAYPAFTEARAAQQASPAQIQAQARAQGVAATADTLQRSPKARISTDESRAMLGEDSGSFWLTQQAAQPRSASTLAQVDAGKR